MSFFSSSLVAAEHSSKAPSIDGYSPVSYFTVNKAEKGSPDFTVEHKGRIYYLTSVEQVELFYKNPEKYRPRFDVCPYSLSLGKRVPLDPTNFKVFGDTLLLFHKSEEVDGLALWNLGEPGLSEADLLKRAEKQYNLLKWD
ncbi:MAG: hypothetical protein AB8D52_08945 [Gammaproteobacteria bacterium]